jgi:hypothetical protein
MPFSTDMLSRAHILTGQGSLHSNSVNPLWGFVSVAFMFSIDMNALRAIESIEAALFPRQEIHINRKRDASPNLRIGYATLPRPEGA